MLARPTQLYARPWNPVWYEDLQEYEHRYTGQTPSCRSQIYESPRSSPTHRSRTPEKVQEK